MLNKILETLSLSAKDLVADVVEGREDALKQKVLIVNIKKILEHLESEIAEEVFAEAEKYNEKTFAAYGSKITLSERSKYDYSVIPSWKKIDSQIKDLKTSQKNVEKMAKTISADSPFVDLESGEVLTAIPKEVTKVITIQ